MHVGIREGANLSAFEFYGKHGGEYGYYTAAAERAAPPAFADFHEEGNAHEFFHARLCFAYAFAYLSHVRIIPRDVHFYTTEGGGDIFDSPFRASVELKVNKLHVPETWEYCTPSFPGTPQNVHFAGSPIRAFLPHSEYGTILLSCGTDFYPFEKNFYSRTYIIERRTELTEHRS